ncbi:MAG TPA: EAL domain-containing protein [Pseudoduganella sp.]
MPRYFDQLSLRAKLFIGFAALTALMLLAGAVSIASYRGALDSVRHYLSHDRRIAEFSLQSSALMLTARRNEKDFLLKVREFGYEEARSRYVTLLRSSLAGVRENMRMVRSLTDDPAARKEASAIEQICTEYEEGLLRVVQHYEQLGRRDSGLESLMRREAHALEATLARDAPERWTILLLQLRRAEKDFIMRGSVVYANKFGEYAQQLRTQIEQSSLSMSRREELALLLGAYQSYFQQYVNIASQVQADSMTYLNAVHTVEPMLEHLRADTDSQEIDTIASLYKRGQTSMLTFIIATVGATLFAVIIATYILRNVTRSLGDCVDFARRLEGGDLSARLQVERGKDFNVLIQSMNRMAAGLQSATLAQEKHEAELQRLNRALRVLSLCNETLVRAASEAELLEAICRHIVDSGGYRLALVNFLNEPEPAAHAGVGHEMLEHAQLRAAAELLQQGAPAHVFANGIALPLMARERMLGTLAIYAEQENVFDPEEVRVLQQLAGDLAFGISSLRESMQRKSFELELERQANFDALTGLANRFTLEVRVAQSVNDAHRDNSKLVAMFIDLNRFKDINDTLGHAAGDQLLVEVARRLESAVRTSDTVARVGGDEFVVIMKGIQAFSDAESVASKIVSLLAPPVMIRGQEIIPSASIGISIFPDDAADAAAMMRNADLAMYDAKVLGGTCFRFYAPEMNARMTARFALEADLRRALKQGELVMYYQPQLSLVTGTIKGAEALVRWNHPEKGMISPQEFIPLAEETGLILPLGEWILRNVCTQLRTWLDAGAQAPPIAVNLSARQFRQGRLPGLVSEVLAACKLDPRLLHLEITESAIMHDVDAAVATLHELKALGVGISLDDFGTGYSSLSYLKRFPADYLKIDQSFVRDITRVPDDAAICSAIIGLAHHLRLKVIAEGVETEEQQQYLHRQGCDLIQGYLFSRPLAAADFLQFLDSPVAHNEQIAEESRNTLLIVDDEASIVRALQRELRGEGYRILTASSAEEGLALLARHQVQVIISDQRMPGMSGTEFLSRAKETYPDTIRLMLSGYAELEAALDAVNHGAVFRIFTKPWNDDAMRRHVREAFRHHNLVREYG